MNCNPRVTAMSSWVSCGLHMLHRVNNMGNRSGRAGDRNRVALRKAGSGFDMWGGGRGRETRL